ncbi:MAG: response regulator transcription factor [Methylomonas sp.]|nr:response regulator transcription factor [Methylomonas sp.]PPD19559.1 MAG: DNA-binding response regulator [Methylomonas sp.]PPD25074.1 MAG: DNA-binding response regulator [Methylomonas sp.]PPD34430.1 MAG: DNA-binding response regulator [Methylomonas sp.]PPD38749.1 MAG: DNA-binding response regulator [Methylomonas sp.]
MMDGSSGTVLIVDDMPGNLALLSDTLSEANYRVLVATDGQSALEQIQYIKPDIILLDVIMPGIDGFETCRRLKASPDTEAIPVLFMTGLSELDDLLRGFGEGALDYIVKPIRPAEMLARIEVHVSQNRNLRRAERLLAEGQFSALAIDDSGRINWLTPTGAVWLSEYTGRDNQIGNIRTGDFLPEKLLSWFQIWRDHATAEDYDQQQILADGFSVNISACEQPGQYLLQVQRSESGTNWNVQTLRKKLKLTPREAEILMWIGRGKTNKEIGIILDSSPRTINKHLEHIFEKLGVSTRSAAVAMAFNDIGG